MIITTCWIAWIPLAVVEVAGGVVAVTGVVPVTDVLAPGAVVVASAAGGVVVVSASEPAHANASPSESIAPMAAPTAPARDRTREKYPLYALATRSCC